MTWATLDGYVVARTTEKAVAVAKAKAPAEDWTWLPRAMCMDGDTLAIGDTDISIRESMADEKGLDWR